MLINATKTKELVIGPWSQLNSSILHTQAGTIERVTSFKLLGLTLFWKKHTDYVVSKAAERLYFLKVLKRSGLPRDHLIATLLYCCNSTSPRILLLNVAP